MVTEDRENVNNASAVDGGVNNAAMREALKKVRYYLPYFLQYMRLHWEDAEAGGYYGRILEVVNAALSAPPRNCDVGTAEEQAKRLNEWCNGRHCINCRFKGGWPDECKLKWAQMPCGSEESEALK